MQHLNNEITKTKKKWNAAASRMGILDEVLINIPILFDWHVC